MDSPDDVDPKEKIKELGIIFNALGNLPKRAVIYHIGIKGKCLGGSANLVIPVVQNMKECGYSINPFSIPPKLSELRKKDGLVERDSDYFWRLTERGKDAFNIIEWMLGSASHSRKCKIALKEWCPILDAIGNPIKRIIVMYLGRKGESKGGSKYLITPIVKGCEQLGVMLNPFSLPPKLSELKNHDGLVEQSKNGYWRLTKSGKMAYSLFVHIAENGLKRHITEQSLD
ncbi:MAG: hypothetical protein PHH26_02220 [Candidatus Thermoplasmatota archaeon]|nr:hypothetical protein [Candidatus Thermoplasmatota archaeon]